LKKIKPNRYFLPTKKHRNRSDPVKHGRRPRARRSADAADLGVKKWDDAAGF
jgi:hypothetical protein